VLKPWNADSLNRSRTLTEYLIANKTTLNASTIVITGDLVDSGDDIGAYGRATAFIQTLTGNGYAVYSLPGNHDYSYWGELAWASEENRTRFHKLHGTSGDKANYPWVQQIVSDKLILLDSLKAELDENNYGGRCVHPFNLGDYDMPLDASHIEACMVPNPSAGLLPGVVTIKLGDQLAEGILGSGQLEALSGYLDSYQSDRANGSKVIVCLHHNPFSEGSSNFLGASGLLDDRQNFLDIINGKVDVLLFGHSTPDDNSNYWQDGSTPAPDPAPASNDVPATYNDKSPSPTDWEKLNNIPIVSCLNMQHAGPLGYFPSKPDYPIVVIDTDKNQIEMWHTDGSGPISRQGFVPCPLTGTVVDRDTGKPIAGAEVDVSGVPSGKTIAIVSTDSNGVYNVPLSVPGTFNISVVAQLYAIDSAEKAVTSGIVNCRNFALAPSGAILRGTVKDQQSGTPIAGVQIEICDFYGDATPIASDTTGPQGTYQVLIDYPKVSTLEVSATKQNDYTQGYNQFVLSGMDTVQDFSLTAIGLCTIAGNVKDDQGVVVTGAQVVATGGYYSSTVQATTGDGGSFSLNINAGGVELSVSKDGYQTTNVTGILLSVWAPTFEEVILFRRLPGNITGTVTDPSGNPAAGANVTIVVDTGSTDSSGVSTFLTADSSGVYTLLNVLSGPASISASLGQLSGYESVTVIANETITAPTLKLSSPPVCNGPGQPDTPCTGLGKPDNPRPCHGLADDPPCKGHTPQ
jgi:3',5'-cyclic AMP phosphodiesterase CpdA/5-hydroxyisourate hydrolase-like protein (transthyretin family)